MIYRNSRIGAAVQDRCCAKAVFTDLGSLRCGTDKKTADFDSDLTMEPDDGSGGDQGGSKDIKEKRRIAMCTISGGWGNGGPYRDRTAGYHDHCAGYGSYIQRQRWQN